MHHDKLDTSLWIAFLLVAAASLALPFLPRTTPATQSPVSRARATDQHLLREARLFMIQKRYEPVENLMKSGQHQQALLKLEEIARSYPDRKSVV